jgi:actin-related protein
MIEKFFKGTMLNRDARPHAIHGPSINLKIEKQKMKEKSWLGKVSSMKSIIVI